MYAIFETGGKQLKVSEGISCKVEKLDLEVGSLVDFDRVLFIQDGDDVKVGTPYLDGAVVSAKVISQGKERKIIVFKYKAKKNYRRKQGHRQPYTLLKIEKIVSGNA